MVAPRQQQDTPDGAGVVGKYWPYDGPHSPERLTEAFAALSALTRYGCNASQRGEQVGYGPQLYRTLGELASGLGGLPQVLTQLAEHSRGLAAGEDLRHARYRGKTRAESVAAAELAAGEAADQLEATARALDLAWTHLRHGHGETAHLYHADGGEQR